MDEAGLFKGAILTQCAVERTSKACSNDGRVDRSGLMALIEKCEDFIALFELLNTGPNCFDSASTVGARDYIILGRKGIFALS